MVPAVPSGLPIPPPSWVVAHSGVEVTGVVAGVVDPELGGVVAGEVDDGVFAVVAGDELAGGVVVDDDAE